MHLVVFLTVCVVFLLLLLEVVVVVVVVLKQNFFAYTRLVSAEIC